MHIPAQLTAGDTAQWNEPALAAGVDLIGASDGSTWLFILTGAQTAAFNTGLGTAVWYWQAQALFGAQRITVGRGVLRVKPNLALLHPTATFDGASQAEKNLLAIESEIQARITGGATLEYTIGQRSLKREPIEALMALRTQWRRIVANERRGRHPGRSDLQLSQIQFR